MSLDSLAASEKVGANRLRDFVEQFKKLLDEAADTREQVKGVSSAAKSEGYDPRALKLIAKREMEDASAKEKREELETQVKIYASALNSDWGD